MRIKEIEIDNFKSFANKTNITFLNGFTAISGPNGSGKSNIIDSVLFALGLSSARALRSEKGVADLISTHNSRDEASVKVIFLTNEETGEELSFARKVRKSTQGYISSYYLNDKPCTLSQIHLELEKYNITPNSYNVMMQGDVTSITNCSPFERRKIIDEIAGVADFNRKLELAETELETVENRVVEANIVLSEIDSRMETLTAEREVALKYKKLKDEKTELEGKINIVKYFDTRRSLDMVHENILTAQKNLKQKEIENQQKTKEIEAKKAELKKLSDEIREKGEDKQLEVKRKAEEKKGEIERKNMSIAHSDKVILDNKKTIENAKGGIENCNASIERTILSIEEKKKTLSELEEKLNSEKEALKNALLEISGLDKTANEHIEKRNELRREADNLKDLENNLIKEKLPLEGQLNNLRNELKDCNESIRKSEEEIKSSNETKESLELQIGVLEKELEDCKILQKNSLEEYDKIKTQISDNNYNIQLAHRKIAEIEAKKQAFKEYGLGVGVETILESNLKGVHAPLGQLIDVEGEYTEAISTALGARARFVVVDDEHVATRAIEILKSTGKDRVTFLPLTKMKSAPSKLALPKDKGVIDFAINLIDFEDEYLNVFYFALGETLVVEDMQVAKKLMGKYRIVTLTGEIFEKSGAITGGGKTSRQATFGKNEDRQLQTFKQRLKDFEQHTSDLENKQKQIEERLNKIRSNYSNASNAYNDAKYELQNLIKSNHQTEENIEKKLKRTTEITPEINRIEKQLDIFENQHIELSDKILKIQSEIESVEKLIDEGELTKLKEKTQGFEESIRKTQSEISSLHNAIDKEENNIKFQNTIIEQRQADIIKLTEDNKNLETDKTKFGIEIEEIEKILKVLEEEILKLGENLIELQNAREKMQNELLEIQKEQDVITNQIERTKEQIESYKARRRELEPLFEIAKEDLEKAGIDPNKIEPVEISTEEITNKINRLQKRMDEMEPVNMKALNDYDEVYARQAELRDKISTLAKEKIAINERMTGYEALKKETFLKTYNGINENFKTVFTELSDGVGTLVLENENDPFAGGLTFEATTRDKKKQKLAGMSGGEKSLTALAFVFGIQKYMPAPFYAFDEVDMHLDTLNVEKLAKMINNQAKDTQFIVISLRKPMLEAADVMMGVTQKNKGITKVIGVKLKDE